MSTPNLGRFDSVELRSVWNDEARDFTPWLSQKENLAALAEAIGLELELEEQEVSVGPFAADILCKNIADDSWVLIENQIEKTDHRHLGQIMTYAAGLDAKTIIWVAQKFTEEHRAALDWLNENTAEGLSFFGLEIELWKIGTSLPAPKFNVICKPNDWSRDVKSHSGATSPLSETRRRQLEFWSSFKDWAESNTDLRLQKALPQGWITSTIGRAYFHVSGVISTWNSVLDKESPQVRVELYLNSKDAKEQFKRLSDRKPEIDSEFDLPLIWHNPDSNKSAKVYVTSDLDFIDKSKWPPVFEWLSKYMTRFRDVFGPIVQSL